MKQTENKYEVFNENVEVTQIFTLQWIGVTLIVLGLDHQVLVCNPARRNISGYKE